MLRYENVLSGTTVWRFLIGFDVRHSLQEGADDKKRLRAEMRRHKQDMLMLDALDGRGVDNQCACTEKVFAWLRYALATWPSAAYIAKTEDDAYINLRTLEIDLRRLHEMGLRRLDSSTSARRHVLYGAFDYCQMPSTPRPPPGALRLVRNAQPIAPPGQRSGAIKPPPLGLAGCWIGRLEEVQIGRKALTWPVQRARTMPEQCGADASANRLTLASSSSGSGASAAAKAAAAAASDMPVPFPTGPLLAASRPLLEALLLGNCSYASRFIRRGRKENRRGRCVRSDARRAIGSWATLSCDCVVGHLLGRCSSELQLGVTLAHMTLTKAHSYSWRAGVSGYTSPSRLSIVVHALKSTGTGGPNLTRGGDWEHTHEVAWRSADPGPPPLLWHYDGSRVASSGVLATRVDQVRHDWYREACGGSFQFRNRIEQLTHLVKGPRSSGEADKSYLGGPTTGWPGWGCHPSRGHPYPAEFSRLSSASSDPDELSENEMEYMRAARDATLSWDWAPSTSYH